MAKKDYVVTTLYLKGRYQMSHAYGLYTHSRAQAERRALKREFKGGDGSMLIVSVCKVTDIIDNQVVHPSDGQA